MSEARGAFPHLAAWSRSGKKMFIINIFYVWFCISSHQPPFWLVITGSYLWLLHFLLSQLPSEPVYHPVLCGQVHLCSQQCCTCTLLPLHYKRSDLISEPGTIRHTFQNMWMWRWSLTGLWVCVQEMCCWVPFFWPWPRISPSTLSACVLQHCSILCRYWWLPPPAHHIVPFDFPLCVFVGFFSPASVHPCQLQTSQFLVVPHAVRLHLSGQPLRHHWSLVFPAWLMGLPAVCLRLHVSECLYVPC